MFVERIKMTIADKRKEYRLINILFKTIYKKKSAKWRGDYLRNKHIFHQIGNNVHLWGGGGCTLGPISDIHWKQCYYCRFCGVCNP